MDLIPDLRRLQDLRYFYREMIGADLLQVIDCSVSGNASFSGNFAISGSVVLSGSVLIEASKITFENIGQPLELSGNKLSILTDVHFSGNVTGIPAGTHTHALDDLSDVDVGSPSGGDRLEFNHSSGKWEAVSGSSTATMLYSQTVFDTYIEKNQRNLDENIHGALESLATGQALSSGNPIIVTKGTGKIIVVPNAGADLSGDIHISGIKVDRNDQSETPGTSETISVTGAATDSSDTDAEGNVRYAITAAYITSNWYRGNVTISTGDTDLSDVDIYHCSFEQFNDDQNITLDTFDANVYPTNTNAWMYLYLYHIDVDADNTVDISRIATLSLPSASVDANHYYRLRKGNINTDIDGSSDGIFVDAFLGPDATTYWEDVTIKVWGTKRHIVGVNTAHTHTDAAGHSAIRGDTHWSGNAVEIADDPTNDRVVAHINDTRTFEDLTDTNLSSLQQGDLPLYDAASGKWVNSGDALAHTHALEDLSNVNISSPAHGDIVVWDDVTSKWIKSGNLFSHTHAIDDLSDVNMPSPAHGDAAMWDGATEKWVNSGSVLGGGSDPGNRATHYTFNSALNSSPAPTSYYTVGVFQYSPPDFTVGTHTIKANIWVGSGTGSCKVEYWDTVGSSWTTVAEDTSITATSDKNLEDLGSVTDPGAWVLCRVQVKINSGVHALSFRELQWQAKE